MLELEGKNCLDLVLGLEGDVQYHSASFKTSSVLDELLLKSELRFTKSRVKLFLYHTLFLA